MEEKRVTKEQIMSSLAGDIEVLAEQIADAMNKAQWGHIIDQTEEPFRDAHAVFRREAYQKALNLLADGQGSFPPSAEKNQGSMEEQG